MQKTLLKKRLRGDNKTDIAYDANRKKIINCFCPDIDELNKFLEHCEIREIKNEDELKKLNLSKENIFDPDEFIQKNCKKNEINKSLINIEDISLIANKIKIEYPEYLNIEKESYIPKPQIKDKSELIKNILNNEIIKDKQREELNKLFLDIKNTNIKNIIKEDKLNIVFDLDNTCVLSLTATLEIYNSLKTKFPKKNIKLIYFNCEGNNILSCFIVRNGLLEFFNFAKSFCNFYINTLGLESYGKEIKLILEKNMGIKFKGFKGRKGKESKKILNDFGLDNKKTLIFDDKPNVWTKSTSNVIISKIFTDKDFEQYFKQRNEDKKLNFLLNYFPFFYYKSKKNSNEQISWKEQKLYGGRQCPFYRFINQFDTKNNECYSGEYLESPKFQFIYMKDVIKIIYYLVFNYDMYASDALKLIRYNIFYKSYFCLDFYQGDGKDILKDIIENCGGEISNQKNNNFDIKEKLFFICRKEDYNLQKEKIKKQLLIYNNGKLVTEKFVLDSFYFLTNLENELNDSEYSIDTKNMDNEDFYI